MFEKCNNLILKLLKYGEVHRIEVGVFHIRNQL